MSISFTWQAARDQLIQGRQRHCRSHHRLDRDHRPARPGPPAARPPAPRPNWSPRSSAAATTPSAWCRSPPATFTIIQTLARLGSCLGSTGLSLATPTPEPRPPQGAEPRTGGFRPVLVPATLAGARNEHLTQPGPKPPACPKSTGIPGGMVCHSIKDTAAHGRGPHLTRHRTSPVQGRIALSARSLRASLRCPAECRGSPRDGPAGRGGVPPGRAPPAGGHRVLAWRA
jgi:hypothetical protein